MYAEQLTLDDYAKDVIRNLKTKEVEITADKCVVGQAVKQINTLHEEDDGFVTIAVKKGNNWAQYHYKGNELEENIEKVLSLHGVNVYITPNSFYKPFRRIENVRKLNALYIDIDYYSMEKLKELTAEQIIYLLDDKYFKRKVPEASFIVITGRGIAVYWMIESVPYMALPLWNAVQKFFLDKLKEVGADPKSIDAARVMRLAGSINQKNGQAARIMVYDTDYKYSLREIQEQYMPALTPYVKNPCYKRKGRKAKVVNFFTLYSLHLARLRDLVKLQELREGFCRLEDGELQETGLREFMCFLYRYWSCCYESDTEKALESTLEFNSDFKIPLSASDVKSQTAAAETAYYEWLKDSPNGIYKRGGYNYKNTTLIKKLHITEEEMKQLQTIISDKEVKRRTNIRTNEHHKAKRRDENGLTKREKAKLEKIKIVKELKSKGYNQREIAEKLGITKGTVSKYLRL